MENRFGAGIVRKRLQAYEQGVFRNRLCDNDIMLLNNAGFRKLELISMLLTLFDGKPLIAKEFISTEPLEILKPRRNSRSKSGKPRRKERMKL